MLDIFDVLGGIQNHLKQTKVIRFWLQGLMELSRSATKTL